MRAIKKSKLGIYTESDILDIKITNNIVYLKDNNGDYYFTDELIYIQDINISDLINKI